MSATGTMCAACCMNTISRARACRERVPRATADCVRCNRAPCPRGAGAAMRWPSIHCIGIKLAKLLRLRGQVQVLTKQRGATRRWWKTATVHAGVGACRLVGPEVSAGAHARPVCVFLAAAVGGLAREGPAGCGAENLFCYWWSPRGRNPRRRQRSRRICHQKCGCRLSVSDD